MHCALRPCAGGEARDRGVLLHLALGVVLLVHRARVVGAVHGLALHAPVVLLLLQAAPDLPTNFVRRKAKCSFARLK